MSNLNISVYLERYTGSNNFYPLGAFGDNQVTSTVTGNHWDQMIPVFVAPNQKLYVAFGNYHTANITLDIHGQNYLNLYRFTIIN